MASELVGSLESADSQHLASSSMQNTDQKRQRLRVRLFGPVHHARVRAQERAQGIRAQYGSSLRKLSERVGAEQLQAQATDEK